MSIYIYTRKKPKVLQAFDSNSRASTRCRGVCRSDRSITGNVSLLSSVMIFDLESRSEIGKMYFSGISVIPLSHKCLTPLIDLFSIATSNAIKSLKKWMQRD